MASVMNAPVHEASMFGYPVLAEMWKAVGTECAIFVVTLVFAFLIRAVSGDRKVAGKASSLRSSPKQAASSPKLACTPSSPASESQSVRQASRQGQGRSRNPSSVLDEIVTIMKEQPSLRVAGRMLQVYHEELRPVLRDDGVRLQEVARFSKNSPVDLYTTLVHCAVRAGRYHLVEPLIEDMTEQSVSRPLIFYESAMKQLAGQKQYNLALAVYDRLTADGLRPSAVTCSCLVGFAAEVGELQRAVEFFESLSEITIPSIRAYMTVLRVHSKRQDFAAAVATLRDMDKRGVRLDCLALNVVLATGVAADQIEVVADLVAEADARQPPVTDVVSYNTLVKGYAQRSDAAGAARCIQQMRKRDVYPNAITYNTVMDAIVRSGDFVAAWNLLGSMRRAGLKPDKFTVSILVKGLAREPSAKHVQDTLTLLQEVDISSDSTLRSTIYHTVLDAAARAAGSGGGSGLQARVFAQMRSHQVMPSPAAQRLMVQALPGASEVKR